MLYRFQLKLFNSAFLKKRYRALRYRFRRETGADRYDARLSKLVSELASDQSFADIGCMWGINGHYCFLAEERGATRVVGVDVMEPTEEFRKRRDRSRSQIEFVRGDFHKESTQRAIGQIDVVLCSGVLYHVPNPVATLLQLRKICSKTLILGTAIIPEMQVKNAAVFYPYLDEKERALWNRHIGIQVGISKPYEPSKSYDNWFWGMTPSCVMSLLRVAGFEITQQFITKFNGTFVCCATETNIELFNEAPYSSPLSEEFMQERLGDRSGRKLWDVNS